MKLPGFFLTAAPHLTPPTQYQGPTVLIAPQKKVDSKAQSNIAQGRKFEFKNQLSIASPDNFFRRFFNLILPWHYIGRVLVDRFSVRHFPPLTDRNSSQLSDHKSVSIGIITVLPHEHAAVICQLGDQIEFVSSNGRKANSYLIGTMPAYAGGEHTIALTMTEMGNNPAAIRALALLIDFPNLQKIIMVGIAGAVPNPSDIDTHVRLGDIVASGPSGVVQNDFVKQMDGEHPTEIRHKPRPPSSDMIKAFRLLQSDFLLGIRPWMADLERAPFDFVTSRPDESLDILIDASDETKNIKHPEDPTRTKGEPKIFLGTIGAANILQKSATKRDALRDKFSLRAIEMESSGISDAADEYDISYFVIRGTCDYCDGAKNDNWQKYAAAIAGAFCRSLLKKTAEIPRTI